MKKISFKYKSSNREHFISATKYIPDDKENIKGIVQIAHGMFEHTNRYANFIKFIVSRGYIVCINDHVGHGESLLNDEIGYMGTDSIHETMVKDMYILTRIMKVEYPDYKYILLGHSMGSFLARYYCTNFSKFIDGVILSGTGNKVIFNNLLIHITNTIIKLNGNKKEAMFFQKCMNNFFNFKFKSENSNFNWLSKNYRSVENFLKDPKCGFTFRYEGYRDLLKLINIVNEKSWYEIFPKKMPVYIFSGDMDPVGNYGKGVIQVYNNLKKYGAEDVTLKLYKDGRHEMLNEVNNVEVFNDTYLWIESH